MLSEPARKEVRVRGGRGLGDTLYVRPIAEHFARAGAAVVALTDYADVFLGTDVKVEPFTRERGGSVVAHYVHGKANPNTTQWQDVCRSANVDVPLAFSWAPRNAGLIDRLKRDAAGRPIVMVHGGRAPMGRTDGFGMELLPRKAGFDAVLAELQDCFLVQVGDADQFYELPVHLDMNGSTSVSDLLDIAWICEGVVAQCSFAIPLAEVFNKPLMAVWSARAASSEREFIRLTTPQKILSAPRDSYVIDSWPPQQIRELAREFRGV